MWKRGLYFLCGAAACVYLYTHRPRPAEGPLVREVPTIRESTDKPSWDFKGYSITPRAACKVRARVLSTERYYFDRGSKISPIDLALGWRGMSDRHYLKDLHISQGSRWYFFSYSEPPLPNEMISEQSKNVHIIPATRKIASAIKAVSPDQVVTLTGFLVNVAGPDHFTWTSSLATGGSGEGSCWLFWVDQFEVE
jgi:hypothetical protein